MDIQEIKSQVDYHDFYGTHVSDLTETGPDQFVGKCPFHDDNKSSFVLNIETGLSYCLAGCSDETSGASKKGGWDVISFYQKIADCNFPTAVKHFCDITGIPFKAEDFKIIPEDVADTYHKNLLGNQTALDFLLEKRFINSATIERFKLGFDRGKITIPIRDRHGAILNIRKYNKDGDGKNKMLSYKAGYGASRIFPIENLKHDSILICEGEMDTLLANQQGYRAITGTTGAVTWRSEWNELFKGKTVFICYDMDPAGESGAVNVAKNLVNFAKSVRIVKLIGLEDTKGGDFTDYFVSKGNTKENFDELLKQARPFVLDQNDESDMQLHHVTLDQTSSKKFYYKRIATKAIVAGKDLAPYMVPEKVHCKCDMGLKVCHFCAVGHRSGDYRATFTSKDNTFLKMIGVTDNQIRSVMKNTIGIPPSCPKVEMRVEESVNIEEVSLITDVMLTDSQHKYVNRIGYHIGEGAEANKSYDVEGIVLPNPKTQYATILITEMKQVQNSIDTFKMDDKIVDELKIFQAEGV